MAAPFRLVFHRLKGPLQQIIGLGRVVRFAPPKHTIGDIQQGCLRQFSGFNNSFRFNASNRRRNRIVLVAIGGITAVGYVAGRSMHYLQMLRVFAEQDGRPKISPSRQILRETDNKGLKLTLYQFQTCPFCCKVRAMLDYHGLSYDVIEVNSVTKKQVKWSDYRKVPILVVQPPDSKAEVILRDSSVIISVLESYLNDRSTTIAKYNTFFPCIEEKEGRKIKYEFPNKYFIMFQEKADLQTTPKQRSEERKWRKWADSHLVHMLSPNVYRTVKEALQAFNYFSKVGQWEDNFSFFERHMVIYVGAAVMYIMGIILKKKYELKDDVRQSLYDSCNEWMKAIGKDRIFMGGHEPNLADLAVYGVLNSIEGCAAFNDMLTNTKIGRWYNRMKASVDNNQGAHPLNIKTTPSVVSRSSKK